MLKYPEYLKQLRKSGQVSFTIGEMMSALQVSRNNAFAATHRMKKSGDIISPAQGFYVIVAPEDQSQGSPPEEELVPILMKHLGVNYYAGLLTAAMYHGATHQKPNSFQIISEKQMKKELKFGQTQIRFIYKKSLQNLPIQDVVSKTGYLKISSPELTAMDLLLYQKKSGGLNHIATVLSELVENINPHKLLQLAKSSGEQTWAQRLGYILEKLHEDNDKCASIIQALEKYLSSQKLQFVRLAPEIPSTNYPRNKKWMIIENTTIESDL